MQKKDSVYLKRIKNKLTGIASNIALLSIALFIGKYFCKKY